MIARLDMRHELEKLTVPTLVMASPIDKTVNPKASRELVQLIPNAKLLEIPVGHATLIHPEVNVLEWLNDPRLW
jgi:pimeloyl-ACP methyl ester carboxylesterase